MTQVVRVDKWDHYSLQVPRTLFGSQGLFWFLLSGCLIHPPVLPSNSSNDQEPGLQLLSYPLVYHVFEWFQGPCGICPQTLDSWFLFKNNFFYLFIHDCAESSLLHKLFSSCNKQGLFSGLAAWLLIVVVSLISEHGLYSKWASVAAVRRLSSWHAQMLEHRLGNCGSMVCGVFLDHWLNPSLLHWQADSELPGKLQILGFLIYLILITSILTSLWNLTSLECFLL